LVKRDDQTGLALGGNKARKLEYLLAEAQSNGAKTLITAGVDQSNHCRQTAAAAARFGFDCILVLVKSQSVSLSGNLLLDELLGAEIVWTTHEKRDQDLRAAFQDAWDAGRRPYMIPYGGSNVTGAAAYAYAVQEMVEQGIETDWIIFPSGSGGTHAGLVLGSRLFGYKGRVLGISVDEPANVLAPRVAQLATATAEYLGEPQGFKAGEILANEDYLGGGYGVAGEAEKEAIRLFARSEGILLDPVYTGRAAAGMIDLIRKRFFQKDQTVLFWHTGGTPALFAEQYRDLFE
jgi:D-cysteine desulfhydrase family pyridoxal phosphate-dependent enzyme